MLVTDILRRFLRLALIVALSSVVSNLFDIKNNDAELQNAIGFT